MQTLEDTGGTIDVLLLDGWKELYLGVLQLTLPSLRPGSVVLAEDITLFPDQLASHLDHVRNPNHGFVSVPLPTGSSIPSSCRLLMHPTRWKRAEHPVVQFTQIGTLSPCPRSRRGHA